MGKKIEVVVAADEPAQFYTSIGAAERAMEAIDVWDGVYTSAFRRDGERLGIEVQDDRVRLIPGGVDQNSRDELRHLLLRYMKFVGRVIPEDTRLESLINACDSLAEDY